MSVESTELERSALERKDRAELQTIAAAMGGKPGSRARKAEIVDMILDLAGVGSGNSQAPGTGSKSGNGTGARGATATAESPVAESEPETKPAADPEPEQAGEKGEGGEKGESDNGRVQQQGHKRQQQQRQGHKQQQQGGQNKQQQGGQQKQQQQGGGDQTEAGNRRRRRRRGREREREPVEEQWDGDPIEVEGLLDLRDEGYGFLRVNGFLPSKDDVYVSMKQCRQMHVRKGDMINGAYRPANRNEKNPALIRVDSVNGEDPEKAKGRPKFEDLTPLFPDEKLRLERPEDPSNMTARIIDLISPIGKGQRGLIVSPPKAGKTFIMKSIAQSIEANNPEVKVIVLLVDERPEEVTDMRRSVQGDVIASTFDRPSDEHTLVAELTIERAKRLVEMGKDVVIILDGITRLARAYNLAAPATGRIMSGGIDTGALYPPKKFFGAARNVEEGGSLTILATALIETGSKMDEVIFEEFKGTGNMELRLDRKLSEKRVYPAIDVDASSTRHEELLFERKQLQQVWKLRRVLSGLASDGSTGAGLELLIDRMKTFPNNDEFLAEIAKAPGVAT
ncbi:MAG: Transcription termination factor Rho [Acidimicrobiales bacterium]|nr:MAG: transcription termination factor Rho [Actinomycetota bacterium]MBV6508877.1 Transcription termination factor Rho [Acidimicrobiales bacterium]RIK05005.1 MAG: transcription termination factor Rho [Acidobacteriota bacterium]